MKAVKITLNRLKKKNKRKKRKLVENGPSFTEFSLEEVTENYECINVDA